MLIIFPELKPKKGIPYCRDHLRRMWKAGKFPKPVDVGPGRLAWVEEEIDAHIEEIVAKRDAQVTAAQQAPAIADRSTAPQRRQATAPPRNARSRGRR